MNAVYEMVNKIKSTDYLEPIKAAMLAECMDDAYNKLIIERCNMNKYWDVASRNPVR